MQYTTNRNLRLWICITVCIALFIFVFKNCNFLNASLYKETITNSEQSNTESQKDKATFNEQFVFIRHNLYMTGGPSWYEKSAVHLLGTYNATEQSFKWENEVAPTSLFLSRDSSELNIGSNANYYMYARVRFTKQVEGDTPFRIYREGPNGLMHVEFSTDLNRRSLSVIEYTMRRVVYFSKGDKLFMAIPAEQRGMISLEPDDHAFGLFEI